MSEQIILDQIERFCHIPVAGDKPCNKPVAISLQVGLYTVYCCEYHAGAIVSTAIDKNKHKECKE